MRPMHLLMLLAGDANMASARVRGYWIADALKKMGRVVEVRQADRLSQYPVLLPAIARADAVLFRKKYGRYDLVAARICRLTGKRVLFDIDDAPSRTCSDATMGRAGQMMRLSHGVLAGSAALAGLARRYQDAVHLLPSGLYPDAYPRKSHAAGDRICLGWIGNGAHYADDLIDLLAEPLARVARRRPLSFRLVGACGVRRLHDTFGAIERLEADLVDRIDWSDPKAVSAAVAPFDIGLYPLLPGPFNDYKCAFKALEYMACALPVIASDVGANAEIVRDEETGLLCRTADDWAAAIERLAAGPDLRRSFGAAGRRIVEDRYAIPRLAARIETILRCDAIRIQSRGPGQSRTASGPLQDAERRDARHPQAPRSRAGGPDAPIEAPDDFLESGFP